MANIHYDFPVKCVHGKLAKEDKVCLKKLTSTGTCYGVKRDDWKQVYKTQETATAARLRQQKFRSVAMAASERKADPTKQAADKAAFEAQTKYKSMFTFLFHLEWEAYEGD